MRPAKESQLELAFEQETETERFGFKSTESYDTEKITQYGSRFALAFLTGCVSLLPLQLSVKY